MPTFLAEFFRQIAGAFGRLSAGGKVALLAAFLLLGGAVAGSVWWARRPEFRLLYARLDPDDAATIVERLQTAKIPYEVRDGGAVFVPAPRVEELRLQMANEGLPRGGGVGFEIFDKNTFGLTEFLENVNYQRALQGELSRTIRKLDGVESATIHLARPKPSVFAEHERPATASVVLALRPGRVLTADQVAGIRHLVASGVEGLSADQVVVMDRRGKLLSPPASEKGATVVASRRVEAQNEVEDYLTRKGQTLLDHVLGEGKGMVRVSAQLKLEQVMSEEKKRDPDSKVAIREKVNTSTEGRPNAGGPTSASAALQPNAPGAAPLATPGAGAGGGSSEDSESEYAYDETLRKVIKDGLEIERLSIGLIVDKAFEPRLTDLEKVVGQAVGFDRKRGDTFERAAVEFYAGEPGPDLEAEKQVRKREYYLEAGRYGVTALALVLFFFVARSALRRRPAAARPVGATPAAGAAPVATAAPAKTQVLEAFKANPEALSALFQNWLREQKPGR